MSAAVLLLLPPHWLLQAKLQQEMSGMAQHWEPRARQHLRLRLLLALLRPGRLRGCCRLRQSHLQREGCGVGHLRAVSCVSCALLQAATAEATVSQRQELRSVMSKLQRQSTGRRRGCKAARRSSHLGQAAQALALDSPPEAALQRTAVQLGRPDGHHAAAHLTVRTQVSEHAQTQAPDHSFWLMVRLTSAA